MLGGDWPSSELKIDLVINALWSGYIDHSNFYVLHFYYSKEEKQAESEGDDEEGPSSSHKPTKIEEEPRLAEEAGDEVEETEEQPPRKKSKKTAKSETTTESTAKDSTIKDAGSKKRKAKWKGKQIMPSKTKEVKSSRGMSFKRMEAYGMHGEVKRVKKLRARDKRQWE